MDEDEVEVDQLISHAMQLVTEGRAPEAMVLLHTAEASFPEDPSSELAFLFSRTLAQAASRTGQFDTARAAGIQALTIAQEAGERRLVCLALETLAVIENLDGRFRAAGERFVQARNVAVTLGDPEEQAAVLYNHASMLADRGFEGAEALLDQALAVLPVGSKYWCAATSNLATELARQGRLEEAADTAVHAAAGFGALDLPHDRIICLEKQARYLRAAGHDDDAGAAFVQAHDEAIARRRAETDVAHFAGFEERAKAIEARTAELLGPDSAIEIGLRAVLGKQLMEAAGEALESGDYAGALEQYADSRAHWVALHADHVLLRVDYHRALALTELEDDRAAVALAQSVRARAQVLGDAERASMAASLLLRLRNVLPSSEVVVELIAESLVLEEVHLTQLGIAAEDRIEATGAVLDAMIGPICEEFGAVDLAETYLRRAIDSDPLPEPTFRYRRVFRLANLYQLLERAGRPSAAGAVLDELRRAAAGNDDPRIVGAVGMVEALAARRLGDRTVELLDRLVDQCRAYEVLRARQGAGPAVAHLAGGKAPPYPEAAIVALELGQLDRALALLEAGAAASLAESVRPTGASFPGVDAPVELVLDGGIGIWALGSTVRINVFVVDGGVVTHTAVEQPTDGPPLEAAIGALRDAVDAERGVTPVPAAVHAVLEHPTFVRLQAVIADAVGPGDRPLWVAADDVLGDAPLHLLAPGSGSGVMVLPRLAVGDWLPDPATARPGRSSVVALGDPSGDLPFARLEAQLVASGGPVALGQDATFEWLQAAIASTRPGVVHLACHGRYDRAHPHRSGLLLALPPTDAVPGRAPFELVDLERLRALPLDGAVVVLSACNSGNQLVSRGNDGIGIVTALLQAGAACVVAARWPVDDLSGMLLMSTFHERMVRGADPGVARALVAAAAALRAIDGTALLDRASAAASSAGIEPAEQAQVEGLALLRVLEALGDTATAGLVKSVLDPTNATAGRPDQRLAGLAALRPSSDALRPLRPYADVTHWGAFQIVGRAVPRPTAQETR